MYCKKISGVESNSNFVKSENAEDSIEERNGYGMSLDGKLILANVKEEGDGQGGERQCVEVKREVGVKDEEFEMSACNLDIVGDEQMETGEMVQPEDPDHGDGSSVSFRKGNSGETVVFACSQCPFIHVEEEKLHQHVQKAHQEEHNRILGYAGNGAENSLPPSIERILKQKQLGATHNEFLRRILEKEKEQLDLRQAVKSFKRSAQEAVDDSEKIFTEVIRSIEERRTLVKNLIQDQEEAAVSRAQELLVGLEKEIVELRRRDAELEQLLHSEDNIHFLKNYRFYSIPSGPGDLPSISVSPQFSFEAVRESVLKLKGLMEDVWKGELVNISHAVKMAPLLQPRTREEFLLYSCKLTLDPNTVYGKLSLCEEKRQVTRVKNLKSYPDHPERFDGWAQVLSREGLSGRCYWEAEWSGDDYVSIAVAYKSISRKGWTDNCGLGRNNESWSLCCAPSRFYFWHNNRSTEIPVPASSSRIGVYLDHRAGALSFYSVSETMTLLHRVKYKFTQPLYCAFGVYCVGSSARLSALD
ncbi:hypothetical protein GJAV_G00071810 [Gymnothorax javanicus]|nr:hypothetical protein GJAV_G00071810 [Gymnothorax javanicus]